MLTFLEWGARSLHGRACLGLMLCFSIAAVGASESEGPTRLDELNYGTVLYGFYQADYLDALSKLLVARHRVDNEERGYGDHLYLLQGAISADYGMEREATVIFERLLDSSGPSYVRNAARFYLGKMAYQRQDWAVADAHFARVDKTLARPLQQELVVIQITMAIRQSDIDRGEELLASAKNLGAWQGYAYYNLGAAYLKVGDHERGLDYFE